MLSARAFTIRPSDLGQAAEVTDEAETPLASMRGGQLNAASGEPLLRLAVSTAGRMSGRRDNPTAVALEVGDAQGRPLGRARIVKYRFGPRAKKLTLALTREDDDAEVGRIEAADDRGERLTAMLDGAEAATVAVEQVKLGFLRKARVYRVQLHGEADPLLLGALVGYEALLSAAQAAAMRD